MCEDDLVVVEGDHDGVWSGLQDALLHCGDRYVINDADTDVDYLPDAIGGNGPGGGAAGESQVLPRDLGCVRRRPDDLLGGLLVDPRPRFAAEIVVVDAGRARAAVVQPAAHDVTAVNAARSASQVSASTMFTRLNCSRGNGQSCAHQRPWAETMIRQSGKSCCNSAFAEVETGLTPTSLVMKGVQRTRV